MYVDYTAAYFIDINNIGKKVIQPNLVVKEFHVHRFVYT